eukprot:GFUD01035837.1.p1 GENE.GFUD01035837.1~~GFUD01035837.1.p1  ORF type:complete len:315 (-),score=106.56 GFUD01035837.1:108-1052(-)
MTENITVWFSVANTLFASIAFILWYFAIWQEKEEKFDADKVLFIDADDHGKCDNDGNHAKHEADTSDTADEELKSNDDKHLYVSPGLRNGDNMLNYRDYCRYYQNTSKQGLAGKDAQEDIKQTKHVKAFPVDTENTKIKTVEDADTKKTENTEATHARSAQPHIKATLTLPKKATFQWPKHENTIEQLRSVQAQSRAGISQAVLDKLQSLGIMRDSVQPPSAQAAGSVRVSASARVSAKLCGNKQVRIAWDNFMAKSRPGLDLDSGKTRHTNSQNNNRKNKNKNLSKAANAEKPSKNFFPLIRPDNCANFVRAV